MSGLVHCAVEGCKSKGGGEMSFFRCPFDEARCQSWKNVLRFTGIHKYANITLEQSYNRIRICSLHFSDKCFTNTARKHLTKLAIPSLNLGLTSSSEDPNKIDRCTQTDEIEITNLECQNDKTETANMECQTVHTTQNGLIRKPTTSTETQRNDGFEPIEDPGNENSLKRKRNEELESTLSNTCENYAQPSTSQSCSIGRSLNPTETYTSYKQKYKELLDAHNGLKQELQQLKNNIKEKVMDSKNATQSVKRTKVGYARSHSDKEIEELGKYWIQEFSRLKPDQQMYAKEAIKKVFSAGKINNLHSNSVKIDFECDDTVSEETVETKSEIYDASDASMNEDFGGVSVKTEHTGTEIFDDNYYDPITSMNVDFGAASVKIEETEIEIDDHNNDLNTMKKDFDSISVKNEEIDDIYDETNDSCDQLDHMKINPDYVAVRVNAGETEIFDCNSVNSDNRCLLKIEKDNSDINVTSEEIEIYDDRKVDVLNIKVEKNQDF